MKRNILCNLMSLCLVALLFCVAPQLATSAYASTDGHTRSEAVTWAKNKEGTSDKFYSSPSTLECMDLAGAYYQYLGHFISGLGCPNYIINNTNNRAGERASSDLGWTMYDDDTDPLPGDLILWENKYSGHIGIIVEVYSNYFKYIDYNGDNKHCGGVIRPSGSLHDFDRIIRPDFEPENNTGEEMTVGYDRVLPDGDYIIVCAQNTHYYLDISGSSVPASDNTLVKLCYCEDMDGIPAADVWTLTYNSQNKFYKIKQKGTNMCLDVKGNREAARVARANVQAYHDNNSLVTEWAISYNGTDGYRLQSNLSGFYLDFVGSPISNGAQIMQNIETGSIDQTWLFIPYKPSQPISEGRYMLVSTVDETYIVDVVGDTGDIPNETNVQLWNESGNNQYNCFDVIPLPNGYYKFVHSASGKCLNLYGGGSTIRDNISLHDDNGSLTQQWAITRNGDGYVIWVRCSGMVIDQKGYSAADGVNVFQYNYVGNNCQTWKFAKAENIINYNAPEADSDIPASQTKYYKNNLVLSRQTPRRAGYEFLYWDDVFTLNDNLECDRYYPGDVYTADKALKLYAVWKQLDYTVFYDANGGSGAPAAQHFTTATATLSSDEPFRPHHRFLGWASSSTATVVEYLPGSEYSGATDITLYAVWERVFDNFLVLPGALSAIESEAFLNINADAVVIPRTVTNIGKNAFDDVAIYGYAGTAAEAYASVNGKLFIPITDDWVLASDVPAGAHVIEEEWRYRRVTEEYDWVENGSGVRKFASFPSGFDRGNAVYQKYENGGALGEVVNNNTKKVYGDQNLLNYIFWHWTYSDEYANHEVETYEGSDGCHDYYIFHAFETTDPLNNRYGMTSSGEAKMYDGIWSTYHYPEYSEYGPWWWYRFEVYQQPYTQYEKVFRTAEERSATPVSPSDTISNVQHWVRYSF